MPFAFYVLFQALALYWAMRKGCRMRKVNPQGLPEAVPAYTASDELNTLCAFYRALTYTLNNSSP